MQTAGLFRCCSPSAGAATSFDIRTYFDIADGARRRRHVGRLGLWRGRRAPLGGRRCSTIVPRRTSGARTPSTLICSSLMPVRCRDAGRGRLSLERPLEIRQRLRALRLGVSRRDHRRRGGRLCRPALLSGAAHDYEIVDTWHVSGTEGHRQPRHRHQGCIRAGAPDVEHVRQFPRRRAGTRGSTPRRSTGCRSGQVFFRGVSTGAIGALQGMLDAYLEYGKKRINRMFGTQRRSEDAVGPTRFAPRSPSRLDEMKTILHRNSHASWKAMPNEGEMPPLKPRINFKFHSPRWRSAAPAGVTAVQGDRHRLGIAGDRPFGGFYADIAVGRQHSRNQSRAGGKSYGAFLSASNTTTTWCANAGHCHARRRRATSAGLTSCVCHHEAALGN